MSANSTKTNNALSFRHTASSILQLVVASVDDKFLKGSTKTNNALSFSDKSASTLQLVVASVVNKFSNGSTQPLANNSRQCCLFIDVLIDSWQHTCQLEINKNEMNKCALQLAARAKYLRSQALCIAFETLVCPSIASTNMIKADSDVGNLLFQIFKADSNFIQYLTSIHWQINKMCNDAIDGGTVLLSMAATICLNGIYHDGDVTQAAPTIFCDKSRRLIVEYILLIRNSAGAWPH